MPPSDQELPIYLETVAFMSGRLDESPWSPEHLEERVLVPEEDQPPMPMRYAMALLSPTQAMEVIPSEPVA